MSEFEELDQRSREIFQRIVESYLISGDPVGSHSLSRGLSEKISSATVRNVMASLENMGLLGSPHISAGRLPTERGLRFFLDGILEMKSLSNHEQKQIDAAIARASNSDHSDDLLERTGSMLSEISKTASLVFTKKQERRIKHVDFVYISPEQALVILVDENGNVDNRLFVPPAGLTQSGMQMGANFINAHINGQTLRALQKTLQDAIKSQRQEIDNKMAELVSLGQAMMLEESDGVQLIVRGRAHLIEENKSDEELEILRSLMEDLESKRDFVELLELSDNAEAVRVFIGSENKLFSLRASSFVVSPYMNGEGEIIGAVGVIGPTRLNYARIVPMVSYTASLIGKYIENEGENDRG